MKVKQRFRQSSTLLDHPASGFNRRPSGLRTLRPRSPFTGTGAAQLPSNARTAHWEPKFPFDLVIAYENEATRARALGLGDHLVKTLEDDHDVQQSWWKLQFLYDPQLLTRAVEAAITADMIILSLNHATEPPLIARTWIDRWRQEKDGHSCALVALVDNAPSARCMDCPMLRYLNSVAHQAGMDFFPQVFPTTPRQSPSVDLNTPANGTRVTLLLEEIVRRPNNTQPWGINEY